MKKPEQGSGSFSDNLISASGELNHPRTQTGAQPTTAKD
jgi:hypothetical protein